jgi:1-aminocyclopropane-1-carboxylate deaminase/D-cysteine desulfhydrase-like pyridoxal-dependent ACC family enzyme
MMRPEALGAVLDRALPRVRLARLPTPLDAAPRLGAALGLDLAVKREDESGLGQGGNKARQIEVILGRVLARGGRTVVTTAGAQSNFCRTLAAGAAMLGLRCLLLLRGGPDAPLTGNLLLDHLFGAEIHWIETGDPYDPAVLARLEELAAAAGQGAEIVQLPGETGPLAAAAAAGLAVELAGQWAAPPPTIHLAAGSGLTAAGLVLGLEAMGLPCRVVAISVQQPAGFIEPLIRRRVREAGALLGIEVEAGRDRLAVEDGFIGPGYGRPSAEAVEAVRLAARLEGLVLDPAYTGKAMAGLIARARAGRLGGPALFIHTGGAPGLAAHAGAFAGHPAAEAA